MRGKLALAGMFFSAILAIYGHDIRLFLVSIPGIPQDVRASDGSFADKVRVG
jgi:hypothetical protein